MNVTIGQHARQTHEQVESHGDPTEPIPFVAPTIRQAIVVDALVVFPARGGHKEVMEGIVHRTQDLEDDSVRAYWPISRLQKSLYGQVFACLELKRHENQELQLQAAQVRQGIDFIVWESTERRVAIKRQDRARFGSKGDDPEMEVAVMQYLGDEHPNVLGCMDAMQDETYLYLVTPLCRGGDLIELLIKDGHMSEPVARFWFRQIVAGLHHLQSKGICHRDFSPENLLLHEGNLKIFDFGMALWAPYNSAVEPDAVTNVVEGTDRRLITRRGPCGKDKYMVGRFTL